MRRVFRYPRIYRRSLTENYDAVYSADVYVTRTYDIVIGLEFYCTIENGNDKYCNVDGDNVTDEIYRPYGGRFPFVNLVVRNWVLVNIFGTALVAYCVYETLLIRTSSLSGMGVWHNTARPTILGALTFCPSTCK